MDVSANFPTWHENIYCIKDRHSPRLLGVEFHRHTSCSNVLADKRSRHMQPGSQITRPKRFGRPDRLARKKQRKSCWGHGAGWGWLTATEEIPDAVRTLDWRAAAAGDLKVGAEKKQTRTRSFRRRRVLRTIVGGQRPPGSPTAG